MGGFVKFGGTFDGTLVGSERCCPIPAVFGGKPKHIVVCAVFGAGFGEFGKQFGSRFQVARIKGLIGLFVAFFELSAGWERHGFGFCGFIGMGFGLWMKGQ